VHIHDHVGGLEANSGIRICGKVIDEFLCLFHHISSAFGLLDDDGAQRYEDHDVYSAGIV
jgi:hypothetical protein